MTILTSGQNIYLRQGDTGNLTFQGLPADKKYTAYLSIYNEETNAATSCSLLSLHSAGQCHNMNFPVPLM